MRVAVLAVLLFIGLAASRTFNWGIHKGKINVGGHFDVGSKWGGGVSFDRGGQGFSIGADRNNNGGWNAEGKIGAGPAHLSASVGHNAQGWNRGFGGGFSIGCVEFLEACKEVQECMVASEVVVVVVCWSRSVGSWSRSRAAGVVVGGQLESGASC
eukprot:TRINITY_DN108269_c0_g1_i1.p1 TRINITY_DN108269_c0_g1~~TRINITY_DN108269_c0_g1_i1.p1  ORF type:complete len:174 (+),score=34.54 TRINITY_DN108269_c0_g1_i1:56-523(+)